MFQVVCVYAHMLGYLLNYADGQKIQFFKLDNQCGSSPKLDNCPFFFLSMTIFLLLGLT